ncbi:trypsin, alkaline B-like [Anticarsia gemmatalis]|uniref:trypsin, alkaline B-like n=1 Tax=Anticarsia gemmatalis TaxID=129554 RepID=UPI003F773566
MRVFVALVFCYAAVSANYVPPSVAVIGGSETMLENYPSLVVVLGSLGGEIFAHNCGGAIVNQRSILSAAQCFVRGDPNLYRVRVGSRMASTLGTVHTISSILPHPMYDGVLEADIALLRTSNFMVYSHVVQRASIASPTYPLRDNEQAWIAGWGSLTPSGQWTERLRHVQVRIINQEICNARHGGILTDNMLCAGWLDVGGRDACTGDSGNPLYNSGVVVGVTNVPACGDPYRPSIYARVTAFSRWIQDNA